MWCAACTDAKHEFDVCMQERVWSPAHGPHLKHGEAQLMRKRHAQWSEHQVAGSVQWHACINAGPCSWIGTYHSDVTIK